jgi:hydrogenase maturation protein HypF
MASFEMCDQCAAAYRDPLDRRYHAQPVSCPRCGPSLTLTTATGDILANKDAALEQSITLLKQGHILAIKGLGGFHLVCDATNDDAVKRLRTRKQRPAKPFAVMCADLAMAKTLAKGTDAEWQLLSSAERPITLLARAHCHDTVLSSHIAPGIDKLGLFLPYTPLHHLLLSQLQRPLVATSANRSGEPIITDVTDIYALLHDVVDEVLDHNRPILNGCDDSLVQMVDDQLQIIRLARGYAPLTLHWQRQVSAHTLALGAQQKNSIAFGFDHNLVLSPHIGDLFSIEAEQYFIDTLATFKRLYRFTPEHLVSDRHPDYASSRWAENYCHSHKHVTQSKVQHHYAHILSTMAANQYTDNVLGFSFDGTGLGDNQQLWGGEAMLADIDSYRRIAHLKPFALIGNEQAIHDPRRIMLALLFEQYSLDELMDLDLPALHSLPTSVITNLYRLWNKQVATHNTSSVGRLFDALACLLGVMEKTQFEGQAGMLIETLANQVTPEQLAATDIHFTLPLVDGVWQTDQLWQQILASLLAPNPVIHINALIARGFMDCLASAIADIAAQYPALPVVLSGGVFQNRYLLSRSRYLLKQHRILHSQQVPVNDGGIALGQLWYGIHHQV